MMCDPDAVCRGSSSTIPEPWHALTYTPARGAGAGACPALACLCQRRASLLSQVPAAYQPPMPQPVSLPPSYAAVYQPTILQHNARYAASVSAHQPAVQCRGLTFSSVRAHGAA
eukprot:1742616-Rhodomonas_salina.3